MSDISNRLVQIQKEISGTPSSSVKFSIRWTKLFVMGSMRTEDAKGMTSMVQQIEPPHAHN
jgi:hypothetical protein